MVFSEVLASAVRLGVPILLVALGAIYAERSGVVNIGLEGTMIVGAFWGATTALWFGPVVGLLCGVAAGMVFGLIHAGATVHARVDHIVSGVALNILAYGSVRFASLAIFKAATTTPNVPRLPAIHVPWLGDFAPLKPLLTGLSPVVPLALLLVPLTHWLIGRTVFGLRLRAVGEHPLAADTLGVNVIGLKYAGVLISGAFAGLAGAYLSIEHVGLYVEGMTQGRGFIALAAMIFGNWAPLGALVAALLFGLADALSLRGVQGGAIPYQFITMLPYALTIFVLAGTVRRATPPAAVGLPYRREEG